MGIASLDPTGPLSGSPASQGAAEIKALKQALRDSFPGFSAGADIVTATAAQINASPARNGAETITGAWNFTGGLKRSGVDVVDTAQLAAKAPTSSPTFTGTVQLPSTTTVGGYALVTAADLALKRFLSVHGQLFQQTISSGILTTSYQTLAALGFAHTQTLLNGMSANAAFNMTVPATGHYRARFSAAAVGAAALMDVLGGFTINGTSLLTGAGLRSGVLASQATQISCEGIVSLTLNDHVQVLLKDSLGGDTLYLSNVSLSLERMT